MARNYWLMKTEPGNWSWDDQVARGKAGESWDGVRNYQAANNMKAMKIGDRAFFYHSVDEKRIVGVVEVVQEYHPDPSDPKGRFGMVTVMAIEPMPKPVTLADIKADPALADLPLLKQSRLSVMPIPKQAWALICRKGGMSA
jgi:predicted RNA-binding protein with PUA-like domain